MSVFLILYIVNCSRWKSFTVVELNSNLLETFAVAPTISCGQTSICTGCYHFQWKNFAVANQSAKTMKLFHLQQFAIYSMVPHYEPLDWKSKILKHVFNRKLIMQKNPKLYSGDLNPRQLTFEARAMEASQLEST